MRAAADSRALALMERVLRSGAAIAPEYPLVFGPDATGEVVAIEEQGDVRSTCAILVRELVFGERRVRAGLIGSVSTDPEWRGRGLATRVLALAEERLAREGCALALLWADDPGFYRARGWRPIGSELDFLFDAGLLERTAARERVRAAAPDDSGAIHRLYVRHAARTERTPRETSQLLALPVMETLIFEEAGEVRAYSCLGRGVDFARTIHEWGGAADDVIALVRDHLERARRRGDGDHVVLIAPAGARELQARARAAGAAESRGILGLAKALDAGQLAELFADVAGSTLRVSVESGREAPARILVESPRGQSVLTAHELLELLFPARGDNAALGALELELDVTLPDLPLEPFVWGLDSI